MGKEILFVPQMLLIGASGRNSGKTTVACQIIRAWKEKAPVYAVKLIGIDEGESACHRGDAGCGFCTSLQCNYEWSEDFGEFSAKDTAQMLAAGAQRAFLLRIRKHCMGRAFEEFLREVPRNAAIVAESNSLRSQVRPGVFVFTANDGLDERRMKPSARAVFRWADVLLTSCDNEIVSKLTLAVDQKGAASISLR